MQKQPNKMKPHHFTLILLFALIALLYAQWSRFLEWWNDLTPIWKTGVFVFAWALLILIGYRQGPDWMMAGVVAGPVGMVVVVFYEINKMIE